MALSSNLKSNNVDSLLIYSNKEKDILRKIESLKPDVIGYSLMYGSHWKYIGLSKKIDALFPNIYKIAGGPLTTFFPEIINQLHLDAVCIGEGDISLPNLLERISAGKSFQDLRGFHFKSDGKVIKNELEDLLDNLDHLPFPDRELFYDQDPLLKNQEFKSFVSGRGCPYPCTYCFNHKFNEMFKGKGKVIRRKSVDYFIEEIRETQIKYGCQFALFEDDIFVINKQWFEEFAFKFKKEIGIPYICYVRPNYVNEDIMKIMKESGCHIVRMAIETGNEKLRNVILKRNMKNETIINASELIHKYGMKLSVSNMTGLPTETIDDVNETVDLNIRCNPDHPTIQLFMPYPKMELSKIAIEKGYFNEGLLSKIPTNTWKTTPLIFDKKTKNHMEKIQKIFPLIIKYPNLKKHLNAIFILPSWFLYFLSFVTKIIIVKNYLPPTKVGITQRIGVLLRFFRFYW